MKGARRVARLNSLTRSPALYAWSSTARRFSAASAVPAAARDVTVSAGADDDVAEDAEDRAFLRHLAAAAAVSDHGHSTDAVVGSEGDTARPDAPSVEERREKTRLFLSLVVDAGVVASAAEHGSGGAAVNAQAAALQLVQDMVTAAVKLGTLQERHVRKLFTMCGARQREDPSRQMWVRMLTVVHTIVEAEQHAHFERNSLYGAGRDGDASASDGDPAASAAERRSVVSEAVWNALLDLSIDFVIQRRAGADSTAASPPAGGSQQRRAVLQSELEAILGAGQCEEPHWWIAIRADRASVRFTSAAALKFLAAEVAVPVTARSGSDDPLGAAAPGEQLSADHARAAASGRRLPVRRAVFESRVAVVQRQLALQQRSR
jgi:hypothetical protein